MMGMQVWQARVGVIIMSASIECRCGYKTNRGAV